MDYPHWDAWNEGRQNHVFIKKGDIIANDPFDCHQKPFSGDEDYICHPIVKKVIYICKRKEGT